jgi:hypothetical protein
MIEEIKVTKSGLSDREKVAVLRNALIGIIGISDKIELLEMLHVVDADKIHSDEDKKIARNAINALLIVME